MILIIKIGLNKVNRLYYLREIQYLLLLVIDFMIY